MPPKLISRDKVNSDDFNCAENECQEPDSANDMVASWVACDSCNRWFHFSCAKVDDSIKDQDFQCRFCKLPLPIPCVKCKQPCIESEVMLCRECKGSFHKSCIADLCASKSEWVCNECVAKIKSINEQLLPSGDDDDDGEIRDVPYAVKLRLLEEEEALLQEKLRAEFDLKLQFLKKKHCVIAEESLEGSLRRDMFLSKDRQESINEWNKMSMMPSNNPVIPSTSKPVIHKAIASESQGHSTDKSKMCSQSQQANHQMPERKNKSHINDEHCSFVPMLPHMSSSPSARATGNVNHSYDANEFQGRRGRLTNDMIASRQAMSSKKVLLPFDGDIKKWPIFRANFIESTECCGFSNAENLDRLQRSLQGRAFDTVKGLLTFAENAPMIMATLKRRFGKPELIIDTLINEVQDYPAIRIEKLDSIIEFSSLIQDLCATIHASGLDSHLSNPILMR